MAPYTISVQQAEKQLRSLIARTQDTQQPVVLTTEETAEPVAVLVESSVFVLLQKREWQLFHIRLEELQRQLERFQQNVVTTDELPQQIDKLRQSLCVTFVMAARRLAPDPRLREQLQVLNAGLDLLREERPDAGAVAIYRQSLFACGLPPTMGGDNRLSQLYLDEL
jgi:PHD/YefM family antitoxin component YafN of YafNO toxin-antitoxin module